MASLNRPKKVRVRCRYTPLFSCAVSHSKLLFITEWKSASCASVNIVRTQLKMSLAQFHTFLLAVIRLLLRLLVLLWLLWLAVGSVGSVDVVGNVNMRMSVVRHLAILHVSVVLKQIDVVFSHLVI